MSIQAASFDPFALLDTARVDSHGLRVFNGGGSTNKIQYDDYDITTQSLYYKKDDVGLPVAFAALRVNGYPDEFSSDSYRILKDGISTDFSDEGDCSDTFYIETLAIAMREDLYNSPVALINEKGVYERLCWNDDEYRRSKYTPEVIKFSSDARSIFNYSYSESLPSDTAVIEIGRIKINSENNDYWEGVFQYDINMDGEVPAYVPAEFPLFEEPSGDINGKIITGTKDNDKLKGKKKDDYIDGKKGNDILNGKKGNDILIGKDGFDQLYGSTGEDYLNGGAKDDLLEGGDGADVFKMSTGKDTVTDFNLEEGDKIAIPDEHIMDFTIAPNGLDTLISVDGYGDMLLSGIKSSFVEENNADIFVRHF